MSSRTPPERLSITGDGSSRIDQLLLQSLRARFPALSRQTIKRALERKLLQPDPDAPVKVVDAALVPARELELHYLFDADALSALSAPRAAQRYTGPEMPVLFESEGLIVFDKPSGAPSLPHSSEESNTAVNRFLSLHPECAELPPGGLEPGLLHRLDTETTGCLAFAKTKEEWERIRALWRTDRVRKFYLARITGSPDELRALVRSLPREITTELGHSAKSSRRMIAVDPAWSASERSRRLRGPALPARTLLRKVRSGSPEQGTLVLEIEIFTGVQHQIRVHLAALGHPIAGDAIYGGPAAERLLLQAERLILPDPSGQPLEITAAPDDLLK